MLSTDEFKSFAKKVVPFLSMQTNIPGRKDDKLLSVYGYRGFPSLAYLDAEGNKLMTQGGRTVKAFEESFVKVDAFVKFDAKVKAGDKSAIVPALIAEMSLGNMSYKDAQARAKGLKLGKKQKAAFTEALISLLASLPLDAAKIEVKSLKLNDKLHAKAAEVLMGIEITQHLKGARADQGAGAREAFYEMWKEGRTPKGSDRAATMFWSYLLRKADEVSDLKLFEEAWAVIRPLAVKNPRAVRYVESQDAKLEELKKGDEKK